MYGTNSTFSKTDLNVPQ